MMLLIGCMTEPNRLSSCHLARPVRQHLPSYVGSSRVQMRLIVCREYPSPNAPYGHGHPAPRGPKSASFPRGARLQPGGARLRGGAASHLYQRCRAWGAEPHHRGPGQDRIGPRRPAASAAGAAPCWSAASWSGASAQPRPRAIRLGNAGIADLQPSVRCPAATCPPRGRGTHSTPAQILEVGVSRGTRQRFWCLAFSAAKHPTDSVSASRCRLSVGSTA